MSAPTLTLLLRDFHGGGAERSMINLANGLLGDGVDVEVVVLSSEGPFRGYLDAGVRVVDLAAPTSGLATALSVGRLTRYFRERRPGRLVTTFEGLTIVAYLAALISGRTEDLVIRVATTYDREPRPRLRRLLIDRIYRRHRGHFVVNSAGSAAALAAAFPHQQERISVVYNGVDLEAIGRLAREEPDHDVGDGRFILFVGRLAPAKRIDALLRAFAGLEGQDLSLVILGEGPLRGDLERLIAALGLQQRVRMHGFTVNPYAYMARAETLVLSSDYEGLPSVLIEALACGCPVVSTDCDSGPREILEDGRWGELVPVGDDQALSSAIARVITGPIDRGELTYRAMAFSAGSAAMKYRRLILPVDVSANRQRMSLPRVSPGDH